MRVGVLEGMTSLGGTLGPILGGWVTKAGGRAATFTLILACHAAIIVYIIPCVRNILPRCVYLGPICGVTNGTTKVKVSYRVIVQLAYINQNDS